MKLSFSAVHHKLKYKLSPQCMQIKTSLCFEQVISITFLELPLICFRQLYKLSPLYVHNDTFINFNKKASYYKAYFYFLVFIYYLENFNFFFKFQN